MHQLTYFFILIIMSLKIILEILPYFVLEMFINVISSHVRIDDCHYIAKFILFLFDLLEYWSYTIDRITKYSTSYKGHYYNKYHLRIRYLILYRISTGVMSPYPTVKSVITLQYSDYIYFELFDTSVKFLTVSHDVPLSLRAR